MAVLPTGIGPVTGGYQIERSLRFNSADSAYLNRTPASAGNRQKWTFNCWFKLSALNQDNAIFSTGNTPYYTTIRVDSNNELLFYIDDSTAYYLYTSQLFRDVSAWYNLTIAFDTTQATASNRVKIYINGSQITSFRSSSYPVQNYSGQINNNVAHAIGRRDSTASQYFSGYQTETYFIDGQALTPSDFGETDSATGVWKPKAYSGTYGTNGFYLKFADNSNTTAGTLGKDSSGNGNNWTPNNFSVTAGVGNDSLVDSPTSYGTDTGVGGEVRGNYATWNPLDRLDGSLANGNLDSTTGTVGGSNCRGTFGMSSGKWYFEVTPITNGGIANIGISVFPGTDAKQGTYYMYQADTGNKETNSGSASFGSTYTTNDVIGVAYDADAGKVWFAKNGTWQASGNPASGTNEAYSGISTPAFSYLSDRNVGSTCTAVLNAGQRAFAYTAPSGFKALCTQNLPTPTIGATSTTQANKYFNAVTYAGAGAGTVITTGFYPDFAWMKNRTAAFSNFVQDSVRGGGVYLLTDTTDADAAVSPSSTFSSTGITINANSSYASNSSYNYVAWAWKANAGSTVTNTAGTITSTVSANTTSGFSIVTYTANGTNGATVGHGLGVAPKMVIFKSRDDAEQWYTSIANITGTSGQHIILNSTAAAGTGVMSATAPSSTVITLSNHGSINNSGHLMLAYCFAPVAGYSAFGSYTGNGSTDGPFVYTGFRPRYIMQKRTDSTGTWELYDTARDTYNVMSADLAANLSDAETSVARFDSLSNGFKIRTTGAATNASGGTYIYACFAESPFKYSLAR